MALFKVASGMSVPLRRGLSSPCGGVRGFGTSGPRAMYDDPNKSIPVLENVEPHHPPKFPADWNYPKPSVPEDYAAAKLLVVWRIAPLYKTLSQEKTVLQKLKLGKWARTMPDEFCVSKGNLDPVIVKNTPSLARLLWKVKHLIRVRPLTFPDGPPREGEYAGTYLNYKGEMRVARHLKVEPHQIEPDVEHERKKLPAEYLRKYHNKQWNTNWDWDMSHVRMRDADNVDNVPLEDELRARPEKD